MKSRAWILVVLLFVVPAISARADDGEQSAPGNRQDAGDWTVPECNRVLGTGAVTFTTDGGLTLAETRQLLGIVYTYGLVTLDVGNTLLASTLSTAGTSVLRSEDAGCSWSLTAQLPVDELLLFAAGPGGTAYGWSRGRNTFYRIEGDDVVERSAPTYIYGLAVDPADAAHVRVGTYDCQLYESSDGGASFAPLGGPANSGSTTFFTVEFDPSDFDRALCGGKGAYRTEDAGQSWSTIAPFELEDADMVYLFEFSATDPWRVWARANLDTIANRSKAILMSNDGGATFLPAIVEGEQVYDQNGTQWTVMLSNFLTMAAQPDRPDVLYFTWTATSCCPYKIEGENLCRYDADFDQLRTVYIEEVDGINSLAFNPAASDVMYLGLESETGRGKQQ